MNKKEKNIYLLLIIMTVYVIAYFSHIIAFETNDDSLVMMISSGYWLGEPSEYLIYENVALGCALKYLYQHFPNQNWYVYMLLFTQILAWYIIFRHCLQHLNIYENEDKTTRKNLYFIVFGIIILVFVLPLLIKLQYTSTAFLIATAGVIQFWKEEKWPIKVQISIVFCLVFSSLLRIQASLFVVIISIFFCNISQFYKALKPLAVAVILIASFMIFDHFANAKVGARFEAFQKANSQITSNLNHEDIQNLQKVGLSEADYQLYKGWFWFDSLVFNKDKIIRASEYLARFPTVFEFIKRIGHLALEHTFVIFAICLSLYSIYKKNREKFELWRIFALVSMVILALLQLVLQQRIPQRVVSPILFILLLNILLSIDYKGFMFKNKNVFYSISTAIVFIMCFNLANLISDNMRYRIQFLDYQTMFRLHPDQLFLGLGSSVPMEGMPIELNPISYSSFNFLPLGFSEFTPPYQQFLDKWHIKHLPFELLTNDILIVGQKEDFNEQLEAFYEQHYQRKIKFMEGANTTNDIFTVQLKAAQ